MSMKSDGKGSSWSIELKAPSNLRIMLALYLSMATGLENPSGRAYLDRLLGSPPTLIDVAWGLYLCLNH